MLNKKKSASLLSTVLLVSMLAGCSKAPDKSTADGDKKDKTDVAADAAKDSSATTDPAKTDAASSDRATGEAAKTDEAAASDATVDVAGAGSLRPQVKIGLNALPADLVICTVSSSPISEADYRRMMKIQQVQLQQQI